MPGRPRKPQEHKDLQGTARNDRKLDNAFQPARPDEKPSPPDNMGKEEKKIFEMLIDELHESGVLRVTDYPMFIQLVRSIRMMDQAYKDMDKGAVIYEDGKMKKNPAVTAYSEAFRNFNTIAGQMGLSPSARQKVQAMDRNDEEEGGMKLLGKI